MKKPHIRLHYWSMKHAPGVWFAEVRLKWTPNYVTAVRVTPRGALEALRPVWDDIQPRNN